MFEQMTNNSENKIDAAENFNTASIDKLNDIFQDDIELRHRLLSFLQSVWDDRASFSEVIELTTKSLETI